MPNVGTSSNKMGTLLKRLANQHVIFHRNRFRPSVLKLFHTPPEAINSRPDRLCLLFLLVYVYYNHCHFSANFTIQTNILFLNIWSCTFIDTPWYYFVSETCSHLCQSRMMFNLAIYRNPILLFTSMKSQFCYCYDYRYHYQKTYPHANQTNYYY